MLNKMWKEFNLVGKNGLFLYSHGTRIRKNDCIQGKLPLITAGAINNGVKRYIKKPDKNKIFENCLTIDMFGSVFYQNGKFVCDDNIYPIYPIKSEKVGLYLATVIKKSLNNSFAQQFREKILVTIKIKLPVDESSNPDWDYMETEVKKLETEVKKKLIAVLPKLQPINTSEWKEFLIGKLFEATATQTNEIGKFQAGKIPFICASNINNGVQGYVTPNKDSVIENGNCITVSSLDGSSFYQETQFIGRGHGSVSVLRNKNLNKHNSILFVLVLKNKPKRNTIICTNYF